MVCGFDVDNWLEANRSSTEESYPQFRLVNSVVVEAVEEWRGSIGPLRGVQDLPFILDDLQAGAEISVQAGRLLHDPHQCKRPHSAPNYLDRLLHADTEFQLRVTVFRPPREPRVFCFSPEVSKRTFPFHPHINSDGSCCSYFPSDRALPWSRHTLVALLNFTAIWLAKHIVWQDTGGDEEAIWLGDAAGHSVREVVRQVGRNDPCPCGSGEKFKRCCLPKLEERQRLEANFNSVNTIKRRQ